jgi:hypothetical protein
MECVRSVSAPCSFGLKSAEYFENEKAQPLHSTVASFLAALAPSSSSKRTSNILALIVRLSERVPGDEA